MKQETNAVLPAADLQKFDDSGYLLVRNLLQPEEIDEIAGNFERLHAKGSIPGCFTSVPFEETSGDILKHYPRMMHPHKVDELAKRYMLHPKVLALLSDLFREEAVACQSMYYFKPPGARGQALHQDNFFLKVEPGTCIAAWMAIDPADEENGGLMVVPGTNRLDIRCAQPTERNDLFAYVMQVELPAGYAPVQVQMNAGDVLFFNGSLIHGSYPNRSADRFRRSFIGHYCGISTSRIGNSYRPMYRSDGTQIDREVNLDAGPCGGDFIDMGNPH